MDASTCGGGVSVKADAVGVGLRTIVLRRKISVDPGELKTIKLQVIEPRGSFALEGFSCGSCFVQHVTLGLRSK
eukprot:428868-Rhodomonas_salina.1